MNMQASLDVVVMKTSLQHRVQNVGFFNTWKTVISTIEMCILGFFCFALLGCAYGVTGKSFIKLSIYICTITKDIAIATSYDY